MYCEEFMEDAGQVLHDIIGWPVIIITAEKY